MWYTLGLLVAFCSGGTIAVLIMAIVQINRGERNDDAR